MASFHLAQMGTLTILAISSGAVVFSSDTSPEEPKNKTATRANHDTQSLKQTRGAPSVGQASSDSANKNIGAPPDQSKDQKVSIISSPEVAIRLVKDSLDRVLFACTIILTIVGIVGTSAAIKTLKAIEKQAHLMRIQADLMRIHAEHFNVLAGAAKENAAAARTMADALIASQRAWIMVDIEWQKGTHIFLGTSGDGGENTGIYVDYLCRNEGRSFAQITEKGYVLQIVDMLSQEPDFSNIDTFHYASEYVAPATTAERYRLSGIQCNGHRKHDNMMVIFGRVKYRDIYGEHETRFGYTITPMGNLERLPGSSHPEYNRHT